MKPIYPEKLRLGDKIRIIAPSRSLAIISQDIREIANRRLTSMGLNLTFGKHIEELDDFQSSAIDSRIEDLHQAFADRSVKAILTVLGGFNSNQLLKYIDWGLIKKNPKIFCGFSDITALNNAIFAKTGLVTYSGPHYSSFGQKLHFDYTQEMFNKCLFSSDAFNVPVSQEWSDDQWYEDQEDRHLYDNQGFFPINSGNASGTIIGANLCTLNLLQGTEYMPDLKETILFIEDDYESLPHTFDRDLQSLIHLPDFNEVRGLVIGRFQKASRMNNVLLKQIIKTKPELNKIPVIGNVDFGHTDPKVTFPVGGKVDISVGKNNQIIIKAH